MPVNRERAHATQPKLSISKSDGKLLRTQYGEIDVRWLNWAIESKQPTLMFRTMDYILKRSRMKIYRKIRLKTYRIFVKILERYMEDTEARKLRAIINKRVAEYRGAIRKLSQRKLARASR